MKVLSVALVFTIILLSCSQDKEQANTLQQKVDSLEKKLAESYKPGFGEFMSNIQLHHAKLWFAGLHQNWELADFEIHEIGETLDAIKEYETDRPESKKIEMMNPALDSVTAAIQKKDQTIFRNSFLLLTNSCNSCHKAVDFGFNVVKIPDMPPFSNQDFSTPK